MPFLFLCYSGPEAIKSIPDFSDDFLNDFQKFLANEFVHGYTPEMSADEKRRMANAKILVTSLITWLFLISKYYLSLESLMF